MSVEDKGRFADLIESVKIGETGPFGTGSEEAASALAKLEGKTATGTISMTPYRFLEELTRGADGTPFTLVDDTGREIGKEMLEKIHHADVPSFIQECIQLALDINSDPHYEGYHTVRDIVQRAYKKYEKEEIK